MKKGPRSYLLKPLSILWAHLDLNQGPPDYESYFYPFYFLIIFRFIQLQ